MTNKKKSAGGRYKGTSANERSGVMGKIIILTFDENEEDAYERILHNIHGVFHYDCSDIPGKLASYHIGALEIDADKRTVMVNNIEIELTHIEFEILYLLANSPGRIYSKEQIYDIVWQEPYSGDYNIVMSHIHHIREKIEDDPSKPIYIQTVWGIGYRFNKNLSSNL